MISKGFVFCVSQWVTLHGGVVRVSTIRNSSYLPGAIRKNKYSISTNIHYNRLVQCNCILPYNICCFIFFSWHHSHPPPTILRQGFTTFCPRSLKIENSTDSNNTPSSQLSRSNTFHHDAHIGHLFRNHYLHRMCHESVPDFYATGQNICAHISQSANDLWPSERWREARRLSM